MKAETITLPKALVVQLLTAAYWPCLRPALESLYPGSPARVMDAMEDRQEALDDWLCALGVHLPDSGRTPEAMLQLLVAAWKRGERPK